MSDVTQLLGAIEQGDSQAAEQLLPMVYEELRHLAAAKLAREAEGQTLQPTALVHEAWLRAWFSRISKIGRAGGIFLQRRQKPCGEF